MNRKQKPVTNPRRLDALPVKEYIADVDRRSCRDGSGGTD